MHEHSSKYAVGLGKIVESSKVSETLALPSEPCLVQERTEIKRNSDPSVTPLVIRGRQRRCFHCWPILCIIDNNIIASSLIVAYFNVSPPFGGLFLSSGKHKKPDVCEKPFVAVFPILAKEADCLFRQIISSVVDQH